MEKIAQYCILSWGLRRILISFLSGALLALGHPPFGFWPIIFISFPLFLWCLFGCLTQNKKGRPALLGASFWTGWWFGFGFFLTSLYWIGDALLVQGAGTVWVWPFAVIGLPAILALFWGLAARLAKIFFPYAHLSIFSFAVWFSIAEWMRGHLFTGFPWNVMGSIFSQDLQLIQSSSLIGLYGLTFFAFLIGATPARIWPSQKLGERWGKRLVPFVLGLVMLGGTWGWGAWRVQTTSLEVFDDVKLRLYQPNFTQEQRLDPEMVDTIFNQYLNVSDGVLPPQDTLEQGTLEQGTLEQAGVTHLIWPESSFSFFVTESPNALAQIAQLLPEGTQLITGAARRDSQVIAQNPDADPFNALLVIDDLGGIVDFYNKMHLVPFGEYIPFAHWFGFLNDRNIAGAHGTFLRGDSRRLIALDGAPHFLPLICYEVIFSSQLFHQGQEPEWIINISDDSWYGHEVGPAQHFFQARMRAVEHGISLVRVSYGGISGVIDPLGQISARLGFDQAGIVDAHIQKPLKSTMFTQFGNWPFWVLVLIGLLWVVLSKKTNQSN